MTIVLVVITVSPTFRVFLEVSSPSSASVFLSSSAAMAAAIRTRRPVGRESSAVNAQCIQFSGTSNNYGEIKFNKWSNKSTNSKSQKYLIEGLYP